MSIRAELQSLLTSRALAGEAVLLVDPTDGSAPLPPPGRWLIATYGSTFVVGAMGRGQFRAYEQYFSLSDAVDVAVRLLSPPDQAPVEVPAAEASARGQACAAGIRERSVSANGGPARLAVGDLIDVVGPETEHTAYAYRTPFPERSQPPSDTQWGWRGYAVAAPLPEDCREGVAAPWFGQPGGGAMIQLGRPIRWYVDVGVLTPLVISA